MPPRVSPPRIVPQPEAAPRPPAGSPSADAYRQTSFVLGDDIALVLEGLSIEGAVANASAGAKYRSQRMAAALGLWSRAWLCRLQALHAAQWGNYAAAMPLVRAAADLQSAMLATLETGGAEWEDWLESGGVGLAPDVHATELRLHRFRSGETLAAHPVLGPVYGAASDLSLAHFGATVLIAGQGTDASRVVMSFGERDFHAGLAEVVLGWLLQLSTAVVADLPSRTDTFAVADAEALAAFARKAEARTGARDRCRIERVEREGQSRYLLHNWRARPGDAPKKVLL